MILKLIINQPQLQNYEKIVIYFYYFHLLLGYQSFLHK